MDVEVPALPYRLNKFIIRLLQSDVQVFGYKFIQNILEAIVSANETALVNLSTTGARTFITGLKQKNEKIRKSLHNSKKFANAIMKMIKNGAVDCGAEGITHPFYPDRTVLRMSLLSIPNSVNLVAVYKVEYVS